MLDEASDGASAAPEATTAPTTTLAATTAVVSPTPREVTAVGEAAVNRTCEVADLSIAAIAAPSIEVEAHGERTGGAGWEVEGPTAPISITAGGGCKPPPPAVTFC